MQWNNPGAQPDVPRSDQLPLNPNASEGQIAQPSYMGAPEVFPFDLAPTWNDDGSLALLESFPGPSEAQPR